MEDKMSIPPIKGKMDTDNIEMEMLKLPQADCPVIHSFGPGLYIREVRIPKGTLAMGHHHIYPQINIFASGKLLIKNDDGSTTTLCAPMTFVGKPGRKMVYTLEDVVWLNVYPTEETNIEKLESTYLVKSDSWQKDNLAKIECREDYRKVLTDIGVTDLEESEQSENEEDQIPLPLGSYKMGIFNSPIEGKGVFATSDIVEGETIAPAGIAGKRTPVGRYTNHSPHPNAKIEKTGDNILLIAISPINGCKGGQLGDEITINYEDNVKLRGISCHSWQQQ